MDDQTNAKAVLQRNGLIQLLGGLFLWGVAAFEWFGGFGRGGHANASIFVCTVWGAVCFLNTISNFRSAAQSARN